MKCNQKTRFADGVRAGTIPALALAWFVPMTVVAQERMTIEPVGKATWGDLVELGRSRGVGAAS